MQTTRLGRSGLTVSTVGLGCNNLGFTLDMEGSREVVHAALDAGITLFDTADAYGASEERLGELLRGRRDEVVLATKFGMDLSGTDNSLGDDGGARGSRRYVTRAIDASLRRLRTDHVDLYQMHAPDPLTPIEETLEVLDDLVRAGKVRYVGSSNFAGWQVAEAAWTARTRHLTPMVSAQNQYSWLERDAERDLVPALEHHGVGLLPYFPLASGLLTGKYRRGQGAPEGSRLAAWGREEQLTERAFDVVEALEAYAQARGTGLLDVAIGGLAAQPAVASVIAGATSAEQVAANVAAGQWQPDAEDLDLVREITDPASWSTS